MAKTEEKLIEEYTEFFNKYISSRDETTKDPFITKKPIKKSAHWTIATKTILNKTPEENPNLDMFNGVVATYEMLFTMKQLWELLYEIIKKRINNIQAGPPQLDVPKKLKDGLQTFERLVNETINTPTKFITDKQIQNIYNITETTDGLRVFWTLITTTHLTFLNFTRDEKNTILFPFYDYFKSAINNYIGQLSHYNTNAFGGAIHIKYDVSIESQIPEQVVATASAALAPAALAPGRPRGRSRPVSARRADCVVPAAA